MSKGLKSVLSLLSNLRYGKEYSTMRQRASAFKDKLANRYWWHRREGNQYLPPIYSFLEEAEWNVIEQWYDDTDERGMPGEMAVPMISVLQGFVMGSGVSRIVQLGHYAGYSSLLLGFMLRHMERTNGLFSVDVDAGISAYTQGWITRAHLEKQVRIVVASSDRPSLPAQAKDFFGGDVQMVIIDSSHCYAHTLRELDLWYDALMPGGLLLAHDTSLFAKQYDSTHEGGVNRAILEWVRGRGVSMVSINGDFEGAGNIVYGDGCGLGIITKSCQSTGSSMP